MSCDGRCCAAFTLTPDLSECEVRGGERRVDDEAFIADMVIELTAEEAEGRRERFGATEEFDADGTYYTCRHWDEETRLCRVYVDRPKMCRDFPDYGDGRECPHGCGEGGCSR